MVTNVASAGCNRRHPTNLNHTDVFSRNESAWQVVQGLRAYHKTPTIDLRSAFRAEKPETIILKEVPYVMYDWIEKNRWFYLVCAVLVFGGCLCIFFWQGIRNAEMHGTIDVAGMYGDSFGYANALFSSLALAGVVLALFVQTLEFGLAAKERSEVKSVQSVATLVQAFMQYSQIVNQPPFRAEDVLFNVAEQVKVFSLFQQRNVLEVVIGALQQDNELLGQVPQQQRRHPGQAIGQEQEHQARYLISFATQIITEFCIDVPESEDRFETCWKNMQSFEKQLALAIKNLDASEFARRKWLEHCLGPAKK